MRPGANAPELPHPSNSNDLTVNLQTFRHAKPKPGDPMDTDLEPMTREELIAEVKKLRQGHPSAS
jgi:hypothetical protein